MRFKWTYLEVLVDDSHIENIEEELSKGEWFVKNYEPDSDTQDLISSLWLEQITIMMLSKRATEAQKDRCYYAQEFILKKNGLDKIEKISRSIPKVVKESVRKKYNNQCAACKNPYNLHFHHIIKFSEGGPHSVDNLMLLCHPCHAEEHEGERGGALLKGGLSTITSDTSDSVWDKR